ncbi:MAG: PilZ domain-containing protein [Syntrophobacterales bacterium]
MLNDKRVYPRSSVKWPVTMITANGAFEGVTTNVSTLGAFIRCQKPLNPAVSLFLKVELPMGSPLQVFAEVVWASQASPEDETIAPGMGVRFLW